MPKKTACWLLAGWAGGGGGLPTRNYYASIVFSAHTVMGTLPCGDLKNIVPHYSVFTHKVNEQPWAPPILVSGQT